MLGQFSGPYLLFHSRYDHFKNAGGQFDPVAYLLEKVIEGFFGEHECYAKAETLSTWLCAGKRQIIRSRNYLLQHGLIFRTGVGRGGYKSTSLSRGYCGIHATFVRCPELKPMTKVVAIWFWMMNGRVKRGDLLSFCREVGITERTLRNHILTLRKAGIMGEEYGFKSGIGLVRTPKVSPCENKVPKVVQIPAYNKQGNKSINSNKLLCEKETVAPQEALLVGIKSSRNWDQDLYEIMTLSKTLKGVNQEVLMQAVLETKKQLTLGRKIHSVAGYCYSICFRFRHLKYIPEIARPDDIIREEKTREARERQVREAREREVVETEKARREDTDNEAFWSSLDDDEKQRLKPLIEREGNPAGLSFLSFDLKLLNCLGKKDFREKSRVSLTKIA